MIMITHNMQLTDTLIGTTRPPGEDPVKGLVLSTDDARPCRYTMILYYITYMCTCVCRHSEGGAQLLSEEHTI